MLDSLSSIRSYDAGRFETTDGLGNSLRTNSSRVVTALVLIHGAQDFCHTESDLGATAADLIANLLHLVHSQGQDPKQVLLNGLRHFLCEAGQR